VGGIISWDISRRPEEEMNKLKVGIAGYGIVGKRRKECIDRSKYAEVVAVCDQVFDASGTLDDGLRFYSSYIDLMQEDLDVLLVCMPNQIAAEVTIAGLKNGLHTFCEKPPGRTVEDIVSVIEIEKENPALKLMYGFNHRYHDSVQEALKLIRSKELGQIINMRGVYGKSQLITFNQPDWRTKRAIAGGGVLLDQGIHMVDLMRLFAGDFTEVHSFISNGHWGYDVEDNAYSIMKTNDGIVGMLHSSATQWRHRFNLDINLEKGSIILGGILSGTKSYGAETLTIAIANPEHDGGDPKEYNTRYNNDPSWDEEMKCFFESIINDEAPDHGTSNDALETMKLVYKIYFADTVWRDTYEISNPDNS
jgi:predicted dehydrogenase